MGVTRGVQGVRMLPLEFENDDVICSSPAKYPNFFAGAFGASNNCAKISLKRRKITEIVTFCPQRAKNLQCVPTLFALNAFNFVLTTKNLQKLTVFSFLCKIEKLFFWLKIVLPPGKFSGDAHGCAELFYDQWTGGISAGNRDWQFTWRIDLTPKSVLHVHTEMVLNWIELWLTSHTPFIKIGSPQNPFS